MNTTTQTYKEGMNEFDEMFETRAEDSSGLYHYSGKEPSTEDIKSHIKQHTLSILQSEYNRLESEKKTANELKQEMGTGYDDRSVKIAYKEGHNTAIIKQQNHLLETINEIKSL